MDQGRSTINETNELLPLQQPAIDFDLVEEMTARQNPDVIPAFKSVQTDRALVAVEELLFIFFRWCGHHLCRLGRSRSRSPGRGRGRSKEFGIVALLVMIDGAFP